MNRLFFFLILIAFISAAFAQAQWQGTELNQAPMHLLGTAMIRSSNEAVTLALSLIGSSALFLGLLKIAETGGLLRIIAKLLAPLLIRLFPEVPSNHPAMGAMIMNLAANALGLGNAATPFGLRAMQALDSLNPQKGTATNAMVLFLAINTSSVTLLPTGIIALRAALGSTDPAGIVGTTLVATFCSTSIAIISSLILARFYPGPSSAALLSDVEPFEKEELTAYPLWVSITAISTLACSIPLSILYAHVLSMWLLPSLMIAFLSFGWWKKVALYTEFVEGAKEGFHLAVRIIPYLVAILVAVAMLSTSGALGFIISFIEPFTSFIGIPAQALPMALLRPLSGSGSYGLVASTLSLPETGPDTYIGYLVSTIQGSTETTFYVLAVYFGAVQITKLRHAIFAALSADIMGVLASVLVVSYLYGNGHDSTLILSRGLPLALAIFTVILLFKRTLKRISNLS
jgi:spore maturation protein SpmA/spore maturation protein SpmB